MRLEELKLDIAIKELLREVEASEETPTYPKDHKAAMKVPKGGSSCASCEYLADNKTDCKNEYFQKWNGSPVIPAPIDEFCSDWYEPDVGELQAYGTSEGVEKSWDTRGRGRNLPSPQLLQAIEAWQKHPQQLKQDINNMVVNGITPDTNTPAGAFLDAIRNGDTFDKYYLWRGLHAETPEEVQQLNRYKQMTPGTEFQMTAPQSFSDNQGVARNFMVYSQVPEGRILFQVEKGAKGLDLAKSDFAGAELYLEDEVITNGRFQVTDPPEVQKGYDGIPFTIVHVKQLGVL